MLTTVAIFRDPWEAHMFRSLLDWQGVPAVVAHEHHIGNNWPWSTALGGVKVQVPQEYAQHAIEAERQCRAGNYHAELLAEFGDVDDPRCPNCGAQNYRKRRSISVIIIFVVAFVLGVLPAWGWVCFCKNCGTKFTLQE